MEKRLNIKRVLYAIFIIIILVFGGTIGLYYYMIDSVNDEKTSVKFNVTSGDTYYTLGKKLKENNLIKSELFYKIYIKIEAPSRLEKGTYNLNTSMNLKEIISEFKKGSTENPDAVSISIPEGKFLTDIADYAAKVTGRDSKSFIDYWNSEEFIDKCIEKYWFITKTVKNSKIKYALEGYFFPSTYELQNKDVSAEYIAYKMLDQMEFLLNKYKEEIEKSDKSIHEMLTIASIVELEAKTFEDRKQVSGVFYNRLNNGWSLGSDVTTYYAEGLHFWERDLYLKEIQDCNSYNTRASCMAGKLPVGPICNMSSDSLVASIEPVKHAYYYFVADKNGKTYFNKTLNGHEGTIADLKREGLWFQY